MNKKVITLILTGLISTSFMGQTHVSATEIKTTTTQGQYINEMSINDAITIVENNYLIQNNNGTFSIDETAKSIIGEKLFSELESGMNQVNGLIEKDVLKFDKGSSARGTAVTALGAPSSPQITDANTIY